MPWLNRDLFFSVHACNKMTHSSCKKWHTLFFDTLLMLKMIHSVVWHALDTRNDTLCFYDILLMLKMTHSVLWHTLDTRNDTVCFFSVIKQILSQSVMPSNSPLLPLPKWGLVQEVNYDILTIAFRYRKNTISKPARVNGQIENRQSIEDRGSVEG